MPGQKKQFRKKRPAMRRPRANPRANQTTGALTSVKHYARITEVALFTAPQGNQDYNYAFALQQFVRAKALSANFKYYRAKRVVWTYLPEYNTFQTGAGQVSIPQMSMIMNRTGDNTVWTPAEYDAQGSVPKTFTKKRVIAYKPSLVQSIQYSINPTLGNNNGTNVGARVLYDEWIATSDYRQDMLPAGSNPTVIPNINEVVLYYGHSIYWTTTSTAPDEPKIAQVFCEVEWEFKDPLFNAPQSGGLVQTINATPVTHALAPLGGVSATPCQD